MALSVGTAPVLAVVDPLSSGLLLANALGVLQAGGSGVWPAIARISVAANVLLLGVLGYVWLRNYLQFRSKHALGLLVFSVLLLIENALALYYYFADPMMAWWFATQVPAIPWRSMTLLHVLETAALVFLVWITWD